MPRFRSAGCFGCSQQLQTTDPAVPGAGRSVSVVHFSAAFQLPLSKEAPIAWQKGRRRALERRPIAGVGCTCRSCSRAPSSPRGRSCCLRAVPALSLRLRLLLTDGEGASAMMISSSGSQLAQCQDPPLLSFSPTRDYTLNHQRHGMRHVHETRRQSNAGRLGTQSPLDPLWTRCRNHIASHGPERSLDSASAVPTRAHTQAEVQKRVAVRQRL